MDEAVGLPPFCASQSLLPFCKRCVIVLASSDHPARPESRGATSRISSTTQLESTHLCREPSYRLWRYWLQSARSHSVSPCSLAHLFLALRLRLQHCSFCLQPR